MSAAKTFRESIENASSTVSCLFHTERAKRIRENREILKFIAKAVCFTADASALPYVVTKRS